MDHAGIPASKVLRRAAELIDQGHCKNTQALLKNGDWVYGNDHRAVAWCLYGAGFRALVENGVSWDDCSEHLDPIYEPLRDLIGREETPYQLVDWNNAPERTADEVAALLRRAAEIAEASPSAAAAAEDRG